MAEGQRLQAARRFAEDGARLILAGRDEQKLEAVANDLRISGATAKNEPTVTTQWFARRCGMRWADDHPWSVPFASPA